MFRHKPVLRIDEGGKTEKVQFRLGADEQTGDGRRQPVRDRCNQLCVKRV